MQFVSYSSSEISRMLEISCDDTGWSAIEILNMSPRKSSSGSSTGGESSKRLFVLLVTTSGSTELSVARILKLSPRKSSSGSVSGGGPWSKRDNMSAFIFAFPGRCTTVYFKCWRSKLQRNSRPCIENLMVSRYFIEIWSHMTVNSWHCRYAQYSLTLSTRLRVSMSVMDQFFS